MIKSFLFGIRLQWLNTDGMQNDALYIILPLNRKLMLYVARMSQPLTVIVFAVPMIMLPVLVKYLSLVGKHTLTFFFFLLVCLFACM